MALTKIFGLGGYVAFSVWVLLVKSRLYSRGPLVLVLSGFGALIDLQITIPSLEVAFGLGLSFTLLNWIGGCAFTIVARLDKARISEVFNVHELGVTHSSGATIFSYSDGQVDPDLVSSALSGVVALLQEITGSTKKPEKIDQGDLKFLFAYGEHAFVFLLVRHDSSVLKRHLRSLLRQLEGEYGPLLKDWTGNVSAFEGLEKVAVKLFQLEGNGGEKGNGS
ncbi:MAG: hypothetical protein Kow0069_08460 [Promethearchaeota archaeon]